MCPANGSLVLEVVGLIGRQRNHFQSGTLHATCLTWACDTSAISSALLHTVTAHLVQQRTGATMQLRQEDLWVPPAQGALQAFNILLKSCRSSQLQQLHVALLPWRRMEAGMQHMMPAVVAAISSVAEAKTLPGAPSRPICSCPSCLSRISSPGRPPCTQCCQPSWDTLHGCCSLA